MEVRRMARTVSIGAQDFEAFRKNTEHEHVGVLFQPDLCWSEGAGLKHDSI